MAKKVTSKSVASKASSITRWTFECKNQKYCGKCFVPKGVKEKISAKIFRMCLTKTNLCQVFYAKFAVFYLVIILSLIMVMQAVVLPLILGVVVFTSYHLLRSAAFALCFIPKSS